MATLGDFLQRLFEDGRIVLEGRSVPSEAGRPAALRVLEGAFDRYRLDVAGPPIGFDPRSALAAAELLRLAGWLLLDPSGPGHGAARSLRMPSDPVTASEHLSADVCLRFLPPVLRRARALGIDGGLVDALAGVLRAWPLSGVLTDLAKGPSDVGDLGRHPGLQMLYAERLALDEKPGWMPGGEARAHVELVFRGLGRGGSRLFGPAAGPHEAEGVSLG